MLRSRFAWTLPLLVTAACIVERERYADDPRAGGSASDESAVALRVATWNIEWLSEMDGQGQVPRQEADYARLRKYAERMNADVVAVAEIQSEAALARVFDPNVYDFHLIQDGGSQHAGFAYRKSLVAEELPDYTDLSLGTLRSGGILRVDVGDTSITFMAVHLKASCPSEDIDSSNSDCMRLKEQVPYLEQWIDDHAEGEEPFVVLGDFNRRFFANPPEQIWTEIDDGDPANADLTALTEGEDADCWSYTDFIDHIVLDQLAAQWVVDGSFEQLQYDPDDEPYENTLSDHCPLVAELSVPGDGETDESGGSESTGDTGTSSDESDGTSESSATNTGTTDTSTDTGTTSTGTTSTGTTDTGTGTSDTSTSDTSTSDTGTSDTGTSGTATSGSGTSGSSSTTGATTSSGSSTTAGQGDESGTGSSSISCSCEAPKRRPFAELGVLSLLVLGGSRRRR